MTRTRKFTPSGWREDKWFVTQCLKVNVVNQETSASVALHFSLLVATRTPTTRPVEVRVRAT